MNKTWIFPVLLMVYCMNFTVAAADKSSQPSMVKLDKLIADLNQHATCRLNFQQKNQNSTTGQKLEGHGYLTIQKPNRFDWVYTSVPKNRITCDGNYIVMLTPDTRQAMTEKAESQTVIWSPISILTHAGMSDHYRIELLEETPVLSKYRLFPVRGDQPYEYLELVVFSGQEGALFNLMVFDNAGNTNLLEFSHLTPVSDDHLIVFPAIPSDYDVTDFQGNPQDYRFF